MSDFKAGDKVRVDHKNYPGIWIVKSKGPANYSLVPQGGGRGLRAPHCMVQELDNKAMVETVQTAVWYVPGEVVKITNGKYAGTYVVIADKGDKVNVAKLGGDGGRYVRAIKGVNLVKVDASSISV